MTIKFLINLADNTFENQYCTQKDLVSLFIIKGVIHMANISWTSSSISSYFNTSLGNPSSAFSGIYNSLNDSALIKSGSYYKLMDSYYKTVKTSSTSSSKTSSETETDSTTEKKITNTVLDELLSKETKTSTKVSNNILDELVTSYKQDSAACTYDSTGTKTQTAESTIDQSI